MKKAKIWNRPYSKRLYEKIQGGIDKVNAQIKKYVSNKKGDKNGTNVQS